MIIKFQTPGKQGRGVQLIGLMNSERVFFTALRPRFANHLLALTGVVMGHNELAG